MRKPQLFMLHFAGGNCYSYDFIKPHLGRFEVVPIELPGRGKRMREKLLKDFDLAASDLFKEFTSRLRSSQFVIYGHSMGSLLALRLAGLLEKDNIHPAALIVSGSAGPAIKDFDPDKCRHLMQRDDFVRELKIIGGIADEFFENVELFNYYEPILRADFEISEKNNMANESAVNVPIYAMMGSLEEKVDEISNWSNFTRSTFAYEIMEGGHFFIHKHPEKVAGMIDRSLSLNHQTSLQ